MRILFIDNGTSYHSAFTRLLSPASVDTILFTEFKYKNLRDYDLIILSGGHANSVQYEHGLFEEELKIILRSSIPILGICLGFELIVYAFGGTLRLLPQKERGIVDLQIKVEDELFKNIHELKVFESHRWVADTLPADLIPLAQSNDGVEIIKHATRCIYGFQFHPEMIVSQEGSDIFQNLITLASNSTQAKNQNTHTSTEFPY